MVRFSVDEDYWAWPRPLGMCTVFTLMVSGICLAASPYLQRSTCISWKLKSIYSDGLQYLFGCQSLFAKINLYFLKVDG